MDNFDNEVGAMIAYMEDRNMDAAEFATLCAVSMGCLLALGCDGNDEKARALGSLIKTARRWADMPEVH